MQSADFRIISQETHVNQMKTGAELRRYLITYASTGDPKFVALDANDRFILVNDERNAARFPSVAEAQQRLDLALERLELPSELSTR
jgi:hypothetical protein